MIKDVPNVYMTPGWHYTCNFKHRPAILQIIFTAKQITTHDKSKTSFQIQLQFEEWDGSGLLMLKVMPQLKPHPEDER